MISREDQIKITNASEETTGWKRKISFTWIPSDSEELMQFSLSLYWSEFDGYEIIWHTKDIPAELQDLLEGTSWEIGEFFDTLTYKIC